MSTAIRDCSLTGPDARHAVASGLANAEWYHTAIPRAQMKELMQRSDMPAVRDTILSFLLLILSGVVAMKADTPPPYPSLLAAWKEILPALIRQVRDPRYFVRRELPPTARPFVPATVATPAE